MRSRRALFALFLPLAALAFASGFEVPVTLLQPSVSERGLVLEETADRVVAMAADGSRRAFALRPTESLSAVAETKDGWVAVGTVHRARGNRTSLVVHREAAAGYERLRGPRTGKRSMLLGAMPLVEDGRLAGVAWLQGPDPGSARVRAVDWTGVGWGPKTTVAPPAAGSQTGLSGAILANGDWLLVWSAYDGDDDELLWSLRRGANWSEPRLVAPANRVPDITASVVAVAGGALATWSRIQDDQYHLVLSRFRNGSWSAPREIAGAGSVYPGFSRQSGRLHLLFKQAFPAAWVALDLEEDGAIRRRAHFTEARAGRRPVLEGGDERAARLRWSAAEAIERAEWESAQ